MERVISIHTPTWGATNAANCGLSALPFQFTRPRGRDEGTVDGTVSSSSFQFTRTVGRHDVWEVGLAIRNFQFQFTRPEDATRS